MIASSYKCVSLFVLGASFLCGSARLAVAAPFCTQVTGVKPECIYYDAAECRKRAGELKGLCVANPAEYRIVTGDTRYCLVTGDRAALCIYDDRQSCEHDAVREDQAVCLDNVPGDEPPDLFRTEPRRRY